MRFNKGCDRLFLIVFFLTMISVPPLVTGFLPKQEISNHDQRKLAEWPTIRWSENEWRTFPKKFEAYMNDHIGFRDPLIRIHNFIRVFLFHKSPLQHILLGKDNWMYIRSEKSLEDYRGLDPFTNQQMHRWKQVLEARNGWLNSQGIHYLFVVAPDKHTIYPEYMPDYLQKIESKTRLDQLVEYLHQHSFFRIIDLRDALIQAKKTGLVYYRTDSHWNSIGGFICYEAILSRMARWFPDLMFIDRELFKDLSSRTAGGGLSLMLRLENWLTEDDHPQRTVKSPRSEKIDFDHNQLSFATAFHKSDLRAVVFRDSFFSAVEKFLSEHFNPVYYVWKRDATNSSYDHALLKQLIRENKPHVVIEERVERLVSVTK